VAELPVVSGREAVNAFGKVGYEADRQRASHIILRQTQPPHRRLTVPDHKELRKGTCPSIPDRLKGMRRIDHQQTGRV
jgi:predicted RNA binding protein YcfA (HicA-like mRNA interferase family)